MTVGAITRWQVFAVCLLGAVAVRAQPADSPTAAAPLPAVIYPSREPEATPPDSAPRPAAPQPAPAAEDGGQVQYYLVDGIWGFWDRDRHFHPLPAAGAPRPARRPPDGTAIRAETGAGHDEMPRPEPRGQAERRDTNGLPNRVSGSIVVERPTPGEKNPPR